MQAMFRLRKRLFVDQCGWMLSTTGDVERDQFDVWYTEHCLLFRDADLVGGFRAIRTDYPYLTQSVFPSSPSGVSPIAGTSGKSAGLACCRRPPRRGRRG